MEAHDGATFKESILHNLYYAQGRTPVGASLNDWYIAVALAVRDRVLQNWMNTLKRFMDPKSRVVCYLSAEFLLGPHLGNNLVSLDLYREAEKAAEELGINLREIIDHEVEPGLGNGGLGRLAACYMESLSSLSVPAIGYGLRYEFGIFRQEIRDGWQVEKTDKWLRLGNPWELPRPEVAYEVKLGGRTEPYTDERGAYRVRWIPARVVRGVAYDTPIIGNHRGLTNGLRLWKSEAVESFDFEAFNTGNYYQAVDEKIFSETFSKVLYPNDEPEIGKRLRLAQQYFFVSCSLQDMINIHAQRGLPLDQFHTAFAVQLNDTHPSIGVAELMRLLMDEHGMGWDQAWYITRNTFAYTNHTLLPEALEKWPLPLFGQILPRHLEIIFEINRRFLDDVRVRFPGDDEKAARLSLIDESGPRYVRMAHLAGVGSHSINGVAALHSELLKETVMRDLYDFAPEKFLNVTNGVTPRRWVLLSNPGMAKLITESIDGGWTGDIDAALRKLEPLAGDAAFQTAWQGVKHANKTVLAEAIQKRTGVVVDPSSMFDVQVKRIHEYKRQHLNILHVITLYNRIKANPEMAVTPRTVIFGGKAAPGYFMAKLIIKLINSVAEVVNNDPEVNRLLKVVFYPNFSVKQGQRIYPAADLSEQISTAGKEASGTGNMKFSFNGALTIGTLDGANVEIREAVGADNFFLFGLTAQEVFDLKNTGYQPRAYYEGNPELRMAIDQIASGYFSDGNRHLFLPLTDSLLYHDPFLVLADYQAYIECQDRVGAVYQDKARWTEMSILNVARMGFFSSDRSIREYCEKIWKIPPGH